MLFLFANQSILGIRKMTIGDFRSPDLKYKGWSETVKESNEVKINFPVNNRVFFTDLGKSKKEIKVSGVAKDTRTGKR